MKKILCAAAAAVAMAGTACAAGVKAPAGVVNVEAISKYVYPGNAVSTPGAMQYMPDGETFLRLSADGSKIVKYDTATGKETETVLDVTHTRENTIAQVESFTISADGTKLLVCADSEPVYRRSVKGEYYIFEIKRNILRKLSKNFDRQQSPLMSPDGRMVAFVADNNIYIKKIDYDSEVQVTTDGEKNRVINGIPDWTYEEEFSTDCSMAWAPDCTTL